MFLNCSVQGAICHDERSEPFSDLHGPAAPCRANAVMPIRTLNTFICQGQTRLPWPAFRGYTGAMPEASPASRKLKQLRQRAGLSIREVAHALGMEHGSSYQHYEDRFRKPLLPLDLMRSLVPIFARRRRGRRAFCACRGRRRAAPRPGATAADAAHRGARRARQRRRRAGRRRTSTSSPHGNSRPRSCAAISTAPARRAAHHHRARRQHGADLAAGPARAGRYRRPPAERRPASSSSGTGSAWS